MNAVMANEVQHFLYLPPSPPVCSFLTIRNWKSFGRVEWLCMQDIVSKQNFSKTFIKKKIIMENFLSNALSKPSLCQVSGLFRFWFYYDLIMSRSKRNPCASGFVWVEHPISFKSAQK